MKKLIYIALLAFMIVISVLSLAIYYTQDFKEEFVFENSLSFSKINYTAEYNTWSNQSILSYASGNLGKLILKNNGIFPKVYQFPRLIGCLKVSAATAEDVKASLQNFQFSIGYNEARTKQYYIDDSVLKEEIPIKTTKEYPLIGVYTNYNSLPASYFTKENIVGIQVFEFPTKEQNPLSENFDSLYYSNYGLCGNNKDKMKLLKTISLD
jgi:hypothetical protein